MSDIYAAAATSKSTSVTAKNSAVLASLVSVALCIVSCQGDPAMDGEAEWTPQMPAAIRPETTAVEETTPPASSTPKLTLPGPKGLVSNDGFSARWTGFVIPEYSEEYTFRTVSDDGVRLWVDEQPLIDNWTDHAPVEDEGSIALTAGKKHGLRMEYYEKGGGAQATLLWESPSCDREVIPADCLSPTEGEATGGLKAEYFDGTDLGRLKHVRLESTVDFNWQDGSPTEARMGTSLVYGIAYDLEPITVTVALSGEIKGDVRYHIYDFYKNEIGAGSFEGASATVSFKPPKYGWYAVVCQTDEGGVANFIGVTPEFPGVHTLKNGELRGGWNDMALQAFSGLMLDRTNTHFRGIDGGLATKELADRYGVTFLMQFENTETCTPEHVREVVTGMKGRIKYYEIMNEPNFSMGPADYAALVKKLVPIIKEIDPEAMVMGPNVCGVDLGWHDAFYRAGGGSYLDMISIHDYEGDENIDRFHWLWKIDALRQIMAKYGDTHKELWQTERAISGVRAGMFIGPCQAVRLTLQRDLLEVFGVTNDHNSHYYAQTTGYNDVPTFVMSPSGPHPAALACRTRHAMTSAIGRTFVRKLEFGPSGDKIFLGLLYEGDDGSTVTLRNYGTRDQSLVMSVTGGESVEVVDSFGNSARHPVRQGKVELTVPQMPIYLRLDAGQSVVPPNIDFGENIAKEATFAYSGKTDSKASILTDGIFQIYHGGNPWGNPWSGAYPGKTFNEAPQTFDMLFDEQREIGGLLVFSQYADNPHSAILDYDLQYRVDGEWVTLEEVRTPCPPSDPVQTYICKAMTWYQDDNFLVHRFEQPIKTDGLRLLVRRISRGFVADMIGEEAMGWKASAEILEIREVEIYGLPPEITLRASAESSTIVGEFDEAKASVSVSCSAPQGLRGQLSITAPQGWTVVPASIDVNLGEGEDMTEGLVLIPPENILAGEIRAAVVLTDELGTAIAKDTIDMAIHGPVVVTPRAIEKLDPVSQQLGGVVANATDEAVSGTLTLKVEQLGVESGVKKVIRRDISVAPRAQVPVEFTVQGVDLTRSAWKIEYTLPVGRMVVSASQILDIRAWMGLGPFPNEFGKDFGPEAELDLAATYGGVGDAKVGWKPMMSDKEGLVDLLKFFRPNEKVCAYAAVYVECPTARTATLSAGSDDGIKLWVNGKLLVSNDTSRGAAPGQEEAEVQLDAGRNEVLLKITQGVGGWGFYFDLLDEAGKPMTDIRYSTAE